MAAWLAEVFGGPDAYTTGLGGHGALLSHHANLSISESQRRRFVEVFLSAADEVGRPPTARSANASGHISSGAVTWRSRCPSPAPT
jgi:hemoglobin